MKQLNIMQQKLKIGFPVKPLWAISFIVFVALILYIRVLGFDYVWDDHNIFFGTIYTLQKGQMNISGLSQPMIEQHQQYFRPLVLLTYYWDVSVAGFNPGFSHGINLGLFIINALLVFAVCRNLAEKYGRVNPFRLAFFASLLYIIHPAMIEATAWISGRFDLLATFFILSATFVYLGSIRRYLKVTIVSLLTFLSLLCKETGVMLPVALLCIWISLNVDRERSPKVFCLHALQKNADFFMGIGVVFAIYLALRFHVSDGAPVDYISMINAGNFYEKCFLVIETVKFYLHQTFFPFTVSAMHPVAQISPWSLSDILGNIITLLIVFFLIIHAFLRQSRSAWLFFAGFSYLGLVLHIIPIPIGENVGHERFLTTPLAFWVIAVVLIRYDLIFSSARWTKFFSTMHFLSIRSVAWTLATVWMLFAGFSTFYTIPFWKDGLLLWGMNYSLYPYEKYTRFNYINTVLTAKRYDLAEEAFNKVLHDLDGHGFEINEQLLYAKFLTIKGNPEALDYFEGIIDTIQQFHIHEEPASPEKLRNLRVTDMDFTIALAYTEYSTAVFVLRADPEKALALNNTALWYAKNMGEREFFPWIEHRNAAYLYAMGEFEKGDIMKQKIGSNMGMELTRRATGTLLGFYCRNTTVAENCERLREKGLVAPVILSPSGK